MGQTKATSGSVGTRTNTTAQRSAGSGAKIGDLNLAVQSPDIKRFIQTKRPVSAELKLAVNALRLPGLTGDRPLRKSRLGNPRSDGFRCNPLPPDQRYRGARLDARASTSL
jgi:hypothetical protein